MGSGIARTDVCFAIRTADLVVRLFAFHSSTHLTQCPWSAQVRLILRMLRNTLVRVCRLRSHRDCLCRASRVPHCNCVGGPGTVRGRSI